MRRPKPDARPPYCDGPFTAHAAITCAIVRGPDDFMQTTTTLPGARTLAALLNHAHEVVERYSVAIVPNSQCDIHEIVASAVARSLGWRVELAADRTARLEADERYRKQRDSGNASS